MTPCVLKCCCVCLIRHVSPLKKGHHSCCRGWQSFSEWWFTNNTPRRCWSILKSFITNIHEIHHVHHIHASYWSKLIPTLRIIGPYGGVWICIASLPDLHQFWDTMILRVQTWMVIKTFLGWIHGNKMLLSISPPYLGSKNIKNAPRNLGKSIT